MDWDDLRYVLAVARRGNLGDAATALGVAHSTVYRRVAAFENAHGVKLFIRSTSGYELTEAGREILALAESVEQSVVDVERRLAGHDGELRGEVRVTAPEAVGERLCAALPEFQARFPNIIVSLSVSAELLDLARGGADVAIRACATPPHHWVGRKLADVEFASYGRHDSPPDPSWVVFDETLAATPQGRWEAKHVPPGKVRARVGSRALFLAMVRAGTCVGILPTTLGDADPSLKRLGDPIAELSLPLWLLTHPDLKGVPRVRAFMDFVAAWLSNRKSERPAKSAPG